MTDSQYRLHSSEDLALWLEERKRDLKVHLERIPFCECSPWYYEETEGVIRNPKGTFFQITGLRQVKNNGADDGFAA